MAITSYTVSLGIKFPIPGISYGMSQLNISVTGDNYMEAKTEAQNQLDLLIAETVEKYAQEETE